MSVEVERRPSLWVGVRAARANIVPGLIVQAVMVAVAVGYYFSPVVRGWLEAVAGVKVQMGVWFAAAVGVLAGAVLPEVMKVACFQGWRVRGGNWRTLAVTVPVWAFNGSVVHYLYELQAVMFGGGNDAGTIAKKVAFDQFVFNPLFAAIVNTVVYDLLARGFTWGNVRGCCGWGYYRDRVVPTLIATWGVWIPLVAIIYALPGDLQIPLFGLALTFWALMLAWMNGGRGEGEGNRAIGQ